MHYYQHHIGDYQRDTAHLSLAEHGAYRLLLDACYATERPLTDDLPTLCRIVRASSKVERDAVAHIAKTLFRAENGTLTHRRVEREIASFQDLKEKASRAGKASAAKRNGLPDANGRSTGVQRALDSGAHITANGSATAGQPTSTQEPVPNERESSAGAWASLDEVKAYAPTVMAPPECAVSFWNGLESCGWVNKHGQPVSDWKPLFRNFATAWKSNAYRPANPRPLLSRSDSANQPGRYA
jgi:uncharacterized protein YdaU (DUF1376 family)